MNATMQAAVPYGAIQVYLSLGFIYFKYFDIQFTFYIFCEQESFELPPGGSSAGDMPPLLGKYTSMLFQVQQNSAAISRSPQLHFNGIREPNDAMDQS
jgi:hypothetical protein